MKLTTAQLIVKYLINEKIPYILGILGHGNVQLGEALKEAENKIQFIQLKNEQNGVHIATGYAKHCGKSLAVTTSVGPGTTNLVTGAATAYANKIPVLLLVGDIFAERVGPLLQQIEGRHTADEMASDCLKPVSRYFIRITRPEQLRQELPRAFEAMLRPGQEGPATICLPMDVQAMAYDFDLDMLLKPCDKNWERISPDTEALNRAVKLIEKSKKTVIISGGGVIKSGGWNELINFAEIICAPVVQTHAGNGALLFNYHLNAYSTGPDGSLCGNTITEQADLIIGIGTRYTDFTTRSETLFKKNTQFININLCPFDLSKQRAIKLWGDARITLNILSSKLKNKKNYFWQIRKNFYDELQKQRKKWIKIVKDLTSENCLPMTQAKVIGILNEYLEDNAVVVSAAGSLPGHLLRFWKTKDVTRKGYHVEYGYSTMGYEIGGGIGVKLAEPQRPVYVTVGDATFLMQPQEIVTAVQEKIPLKILVLDNNGCQVIRNLQKNSGFIEFANEYKFRKNKKLEGDYLQLNFAKIAEGMGAVGLQANNPEEVITALNKAKQINNCPVVIDIKLESGRKFPSGYNSWWDVPRPEISKRKEMQKQLKKYKEEKKKQVIR